MVVKKHACRFTELERYLVVISTGLRSVLLVRVTERRNASAGPSNEEKLMDSRVATRRPSRPPPAAGCCRHRRRSGCARRAGRHRRRRDAHGEVGPHRAVRERWQVEHRHRQRLLRRAAVLAAARGRRTAAKGSPHKASKAQQINVAERDPGRAGLEGVAGVLEEARLPALTGSAHRDVGRAQRLPDDVGDGLERSGSRVRRRGEHHVHRPIDRHVGHDHRVGHAVVQRAASGRRSPPAAPRSGSAPPAW